MKILIATSTPFHLAQLARELSELNHDVTIIGYMPSWKMKRYDLGKAKYKSLFWYCPPIFLLALQHIYPKIQRKVVFKIMNFVDNLLELHIDNCDIFIGLSGVTVKSLKTAKNKFGAITILERGSAHVLKQNELISTNKSSLPIEYINRELSGYKYADKISIPSKFSEKSFLEQNIDTNKLFVNNYGVNLSNFKDLRNTFDHSKIAFKKVNGLFVGGWSYQKGVDLLTEAMDKNKTLYITHIGSNGGIEFPKHDRFKSIGHIPNNELQKYYSQFDFLILPSRQDGFGMVLLEALACNTPIIASMNTGAIDIYEKIKNKDAVTLIESLTSDGILKSIEKLYSQNVTADLLSPSDKDYFSWKNYGERYNNYLKGLAK